jgi:hypothetical protein
VQSRDGRLFSPPVALRSSSLVCAEIHLWKRPLGFANRTDDDATTQIGANVKVLAVGDCIISELRAKLKQHFTAQHNNDNANSTIEANANTNRDSATSSQTSNATTESSQEEKEAEPNKFTDNQLKNHKYKLIVPLHSIHVLYKDTLKVFKVKNIYSLLLYN